jgi:ankyrin repeat protein
MSEFFDAIRSGDAARVSAMLDADPALLAAQENNVSALMTAVYHGKSDVARIFTDRKTDLTLHEACAVGDLDGVRKIIDGDSSLVDAKSPDGFPPVGLAIFFRQPAIARLLIERGANVNAAADNAQRVTPLHAAAAVCDRETTRLLLERGADPNARQQLEYAPLHGAASRGDIEMAKMLLASGADRSARGSDGMSAADIARKYGQAEFASWIEA